MIKKILLAMFLLMLIVETLQSPKLLFLILPLVAIFGIPYFETWRAIKRTNK